MAQKGCKKLITARVSTNRVAFVSEGRISLSPFHPFVFSLCRRRRRREREREIELQRAGRQRWHTCRTKAYKKKSGDYCLEYRKKIGNIFLDIPPMALFLPRGVFFYRKSRHKRDQVRCRVSALFTLYLLSSHFFYEKQINKEIAHRV